MDKNIDLGALSTNEVRDLLTKTAKELHLLKCELTRRHKQQYEYANKAFQAWMKFVVNTDESNTAPKEPDLIPVAHNPHGNPVYLDRQGRVQAAPKEAT